MYLATLGPQNRALSTYFIATLDGVGGGGARQKRRSQKSSQTTQQKPTAETKANTSPNI